MKTKPSRFIKSLLILLTVSLQLSVYSWQTRNIPVVDFEQFESNLYFSNDTTYVVNFWATWCVPCRKELPFFEKVHQNNTDQKVKVILVSLDFPAQIESTLKPFLEKYSITADVILLNDPNSNAWIDKVDPSWSGALPATLIYNKEKRKFFEKELDYESIQHTIHEINNH